MKLTDFPRYRELLRIVVSFAQMKPENDHVHAVQLVCSSALEHYRGVIQLCIDNNPIPAKALSRVLLETLVTAVVLAKHPERLSDFMDCARYLHLRSLKLGDWEVVPEVESRRQKLIAEHGVDYDALHRKFGKKPWYGMTRRAALIEAGFDVHIYDGFYRHTSDFIHADPSRYVMRNLKGEWVFGRSNLKEAVYLFGAFASSTSLLLIASEQLNSIFELHYEEKLENFKKKFFEFAPKYKEEVLEASISGQYSHLPSTVRRGLKYQ